MSAECQTRCWCGEHHPMGVSIRPTQYGSFTEVHHSLCPVCPSASQPMSAETPAPSAAEVEALLAHRLGWEPERAVCRAPGCDWSVPMRQVMHPDDQHRAHVAAVLAAYVVEKQREAVEAAADLIDSGPSFPLSPSVISELVREHAATTYPTPKETP